MSPSDQPRGFAVLYDPRLNKGTGFSDEERDRLGIRGLVPPGLFSLKEQQGRILENLHGKPTDLERYIFCIALQDRNEHLFYRTLIDYIEELMPIIYTPTVGDACKRFAHIYRRPRGMYVTAADRGRVAQVLDNWPTKDVRVIVVTDGERILGLGDLGASGMGIPIGKLALYTACSGVRPEWCLPIMLDVGTDNSELRDDPFYLGLHQPRLQGEEYRELVEELAMAVKDRFPKAIFQFEDFANRNAIPLLAEYRDRLRCFNDDIQGTASVVLAGLLAATRITGRPLQAEKLLFMGAGAAATGIAALIVRYHIAHGMSEAEARRRCWFVDSGGLVAAGRKRLAGHKLPFAHEHEPVADLQGAVTALHPSALIGVSGQPQTFTQPILAAIAEEHPRPIVFALSNPTSRAECTAEQAYRSTGGRAIFASGSPFDPVELDGKTFVPGQGNNAYIFPGLGLGVIASGARLIPEEMFEVAAATLAGQVTESLLAQGRLYPPLREIRRVSRAIAVDIARYAYDHDLATEPEPDDLEAHITGLMYQPTYGDC